MSILVVDGMGGGLGAQIIVQLRQIMPAVEIVAVGTNSAATTNMVKAGASRGATGHNAIKVCLQSAECVIGPLGIILADSMLGEITPGIASMIGKAGIPRVLIPVNHKNIEIIGLQANSTMADLVKNAALRVQKILNRQSY